MAYLFISFWRKNIVFLPHLTSKYFKIQWHFFRVAKKKLSCRRSQINIKCYGLFSTFFSFHVAYTIFDNTNKHCFEGLNGTTLLSCLLWFLTTFNKWCTCCIWCHIKMILSSCILGSFLNNINSVLFRNLSTRLHLHNIQVHVNIKFR